jgi:hypothetical protein
MCSLRKHRRTSPLVYQVVSPLVLVLIVLLLPTSHLPHVFLEGLVELVGVIVAVLHAVGTLLSY